MNLKLFGSIGAVILVISAIGFAYKKGGDVTRLQYQNQAKEQELRDYQKLQYLKSQAESQQAINGKKYKELNNELLQTTDNLRHCTLNASSVRIVHQSRMQATASNSADDATIARIIADSESELTAQDITLTLINHDAAYFNCKAVVDSWQEWYKTMNEGR